MACYERLVHAIQRIAALHITWCSCSCIIRLISSINVVASILQEVLQATRTQLEREMCLEDAQRIQDLPAYNLLYK